MLRKAIEAYQREVYWLYEGAGLEFQIIKMEKDMGTEGIQDKYVIHIPILASSCFLVRQ